MAKPKVRLQFKNTEPELCSKKYRNANYDYDEQASPKVPMGQDEYANLPQQPKIMRFSHNHGYRDGIINDFSVSVYEVSDVDENGYYGHD